MHQLRLSFLGAFEAFLNEQPLTHFRSSKIQALLIYLALNRGQAHEREELATLLWPEEPNETAKQNLRQSLYRLRQLTGDAKTGEIPFFLVTRSTVRFNPASDHYLDVAEFREGLKEHQLERAADLYQGELLPGFACDSVEFESWLRQSRDHLQQTALDTLYQLGSQHLSQGKYQLAKQAAWRQLEIEPWREEAHRQLMQAYALLGDRSAALSQYETCVRQLEEELGVEPSQETQTLVTYIREQQKRAIQQAQRDLRARGRKQLVIPFVGRRREFTQLTEAYSQAAAKQLQVVSLTGTAGIGKTRLAQHFLAWAAAQGADVLVGRAFENSSGLSYLPLTQLLRPRLKREPKLDQRLSEIWLAQLTSILPELRERYPGLPQPIQDEAIAQHHLFEALTRLGKILAESQPLILYIDDWHWADAASLEALQYALIHWAEEGHPIFVLLTLRIEALVELEEVQRWRAQIRRHVTSTEIELSGLTIEETDALIRDILHSDERSGEAESDSDQSRFSRWLYSETAGHPLFLAESLKSLVDEGIVEADVDASAWQLNQNSLQAVINSGRSVSDIQPIIRAWLQRITPAANGILTAAAVLDQEATFDHLQQVAGLNEREALTALDELLDKQLLLEGDPQPQRLDPIYQFSHGKISQVVYDEAGQARRKVLHRQSFNRLKAGQAPAAELAHHARYAGLTLEAIHHSRLAGDEAIATLAHQVALAHYQTAFNLGEQSGWPTALSIKEAQAIFMGLGLAAEAGSEWETAQKAYQQMVAYAKEKGDPSMECMGLNRLAHILGNRLNDVQQAVELFDEARRLAERHGDLRRLAETEGNLAHFYVYRTVGEQLKRPDPSRALALAYQVEDNALIARSLTAMAMSVGEAGDWERAAAYANQSTQAHAEVGNLYEANDNRAGNGLMLMMCGRLQESLVKLEEVIAFVKQHDLSWRMVSYTWMLGMTLNELGRYGEAYQLMMSVHTEAQEVDFPPDLLLTELIKGIIERNLMVFEAAEEGFLICLKMINAGPDAGWIKEWVWAELTAYYALTNQWEAGYPYAREMVQATLDRSQLQNNLSFWLDIKTLLQNGDDALARAALEQYPSLVGEIPRAQFGLLRAQAVLARWDGQDTEAISYLEAALEIAREYELISHTWTLLAELGKLYADQGAMEKGQKAFKAAADIIHQIANGIKDEALKNGFLSAEPIQSVLGT
ncbi:MAG: AAA family ATPase [Chloroflexota bacterium]